MPIQQNSHVSMHQLAFNYHQQFNIPPNIPIFQEALVRYSNAQQISLLLHLPNPYNDEMLNIFLLHDERRPMSTGYKKAIAAQYQNLPNTAAEDLDWTLMGQDDPTLRSIITKLLSVLEVRWEKLCAPDSAHCDAEPPMPIELQYLLNICPALCCLAVKMGDYIKNTTLREVVQIYPVFDMTRPAILH